MDVPHLSNVATLVQLTRYALQTPRTPRPLLPQPGNQAPGSDCSLHFAFSAGLLLRRDMMGFTPIRRWMSRDIFGSSRILCDIGGLVVKEIIRHCS